MQSASELSAHVRSAAPLRLLSLPYEIVTIIVNALADRSEDDLLLGEFRLPTVPMSNDRLESVAALSLTSRALYEVCAPILYRRIHFSSFTRIFLFFRTLHYTPRIRQYVTELNFSLRRLWWPSFEVDEMSHAKTAAALLETFADEVHRDGQDEYKLCIMGKTLQLLPGLRALGAPLEVFLWFACVPEAEKIDGRSLWALHIHGEELSFCNGQLADWLRAFQSNRQPLKLLKLVYAHLCPRNVESHHLHGKWLSVGLSLSTLDMSIQRDDCLAEMLRACTQLKNLCLTGLSDSDHYRHGMEAIAACPHLGSTLETLTISIDDPNNEPLDWIEGVNLNPVFKILSRLKNLQVLLLPLPLTVLNTPLTVDLPSKLVELHFCWRVVPDRHQDLLIDGDLIDTLAEAIAAASQLPAHLKMIVFLWSEQIYDCVVPSRCICSVYEDAPFERYDEIAASVNFLEEACNSRGITVDHWEYGDE